MSFLYLRGVLLCIYNFGMLFVFFGNFIPSWACGRSGSLSGTFPISCNRPARLLIWDLNQFLRHCSTQISNFLLCCSRFCPKEERYFIFPPNRITHGACVNARSISVFFTGFYNFLLYICFYLCNNFLYSCRMNTSVCHKFFKGLPCNFATYGSYADKIIVSGVSSITISTP